MQVILDKNGLNIQFNHKEMEAFYEILADAYAYQCERGTNSSRDISVRSMIDGFSGD